MLFSNLMQTLALVLAFIALTEAQTPPLSPYGKTTNICVSKNGVPVSVNGYPSTPYVLTPFKDVVTNPVAAVPKEKQCRADGHCIYSFEEDVKNVQARVFDNVFAGCRAQPATNFLTYGGTIPAATITMPTGHESLVRFNNKIDTTGFYAGTYAPCVGARIGRPFSVHFHGSASLAPYDGWADDETCGGETKDYIYPNNRPNTGWYHDHALHVTADNAYQGTAGFYIISNKKKHGGCGEPYNMEDMEERLLILGDRLLDSTCQNRMEPATTHSFSFYGDINSVNGVPYPVMNIDPKWIRLRTLVASISRPYYYQIKDVRGNDVSSKKCWIIATDGGYRQAPVAFPAGGLLHAVAERYEIVCDFSAYAGQTLWWWNNVEKTTFGGVPMFCYSHLIAKINVAKTVAAGTLAPVFNAALTPATVGVLTPITQALTTTDYNAAVAMAAQGKPHRRFDFQQSGGVWTINGETWDTFKIAATDVGQNTWEVWEFRTGGGWFHPIHMHLVDFYVLQRNGKAVQTWEQMSPKDVFFLGPSNDVYVLARMGAHKGDYMFHCHNLIHEDHDMLRAYQVKDASIGPNAASASQYVANPLNSIIYSNYAYADPMFADVAAKPTATMPTLSAALTTALNANVYRIFYPTADDKLNYGSYYNPWESKWCPTVF